MEKMKKPFGKMNLFAGYMLIELLRSVFMSQMNIMSYEQLEWESRFDAVVASVLILLDRRNENNLSNGK